MSQKLSCRRCDEISKLVVGGKLAKIGKGLDDMEQFNLEKENVSKEIVVFGCGKRCQQIIPIIEESDFKIIAVIDNDADKWNKTVCGYKILAPSALKVSVNSYYLITVHNEEMKRSIRKQLIEKYNFDSTKEISYEDLLLEVCKKSLYDENEFRNLKVNYNSKRKTIFTLNSGMVLGGIETWTTGVCKQLEKEDVDIVILAKKLKEDEVDTEKIEYVELENQYISSKNFNNILKRIVRHLPCAIVTNHPDMFLTVACVLKNLLKDQIKIVSVIHGDVEENYTALCNKDNYIDTYVVVSRDIERKLIERGIDSNKVKHMTCPIDCSQYMEHEYSSGNEEELKIGYAGRIIIHQKRIDLLIMLVKRLEELKINYHFYIAGSGPAESMIHELIEERFLHNRVTLLGNLQQEEMPLFWSKMDVCVNVADYEGRSISIMEAMGNGAVPIVTDVSGVNENITDGINGYIVPVGDYETMAKRIEYIAEHKEYLSGMGERAHEEIIKDASMEKHVIFWKDILNAL